MPGLTAGVEEKGSPVNDNPLIGENEEANEGDIGVDLGPQ